MNRVLNLSQQCALQMMKADGILCKIIRNCLLYAEMPLVDGGEPGKLYFPFSVFIRWFCFGPNARFLGPTLMSLTGTMFKLHLGTYSIF